MASSKEYLTFILEQLFDLEGISYRAMMGEYIIYYREKIVGGIYDDRLLVKPVKSAVSLMPTDMFRNVRVNGTKAILVAVFGNRAIDDTLLEMQDILEASGFVCIAGMEAVAEHSLMHQFGTGRPDQQDEKELLEFAAKIMQNSEAQRIPAFPGNRPYREYGGVPFKPVANGKCTSCGLCAKECPAGAIPLDNPKMTDKDKCISCMHCVAVCPKKARNYSKLVSFIAGLKMKKVCSGRKENKLYL